MNRYIARLQQKLDSGQFVVTAEVCPPKGCDCEEFLATARVLSPLVDAINVTDNQGAHMRISPLAAAALLVAEGIEPIFQLTCRDRNRLALQSELLGAAALGITNILALTGDHIFFGDHKEAKPVFDLDSVQLLEVIARLNSGEDFSGNKLHGVPAFYAGAAAAPQAEPFELSIIKLRKKAASGARFLQTQAVFDIDSFRKFSVISNQLGLKTIAGILLLKSARMARFINANIPGLKIPETIISELEASPDPAAAGLDIACRLAAEVKPLCNGVHIMAMGSEKKVPSIVTALKG